MLNTMKRPIFHRGTLFTIALILAATAGWQAHKWQYHSSHLQERRVVMKGYEFTSPLLDVELPEGVNIDYEPQPFKYKVRAFIKERIAAGQAKNIAVYYRDLHSGPWFGINRDIEFNPASMMKVPVMIAWLKRAEKEPAILNRRMTFREDRSNPIPEQYTKPARTLIPGQSYPVEELLRYMINYSDNRATLLLYQALSEEDINDVMSSMDINNNPTQEGNSLTIHGYSGFFRILYNAAYLNRDMSEKALRLLSFQDFALGISAGVPKDVKVAAKFGEIVPQDPSEDIQLHEFGIVYHPKGHYILGVMTRGSDYSSQAAIIRDVSALIYNEIESNSIR